MFQRVARSSFSLLVRVVDGLADCDFDDPTVTELLTEFMAELVADGELNLARALRSKFIQKFEARQARRLPDLDTSGLTLSTTPKLPPSSCPTSSRLAMSGRSTGPGAQQCKITHKNLELSVLTVWSAPVGAILSCSVRD